MRNSIVLENSFILVAWVCSAFVCSMDFVQNISKYFESPFDFFFLSLSQLLSG